jgi:Protein of unknown function (DUF2844)
MSMRLSSWARAVGLASLTLASLPALAGLGGDISSVQADRTEMRAQVRATAPTVGYSVEQMQLPSGTVVTEYLAPNGKVFAVSWYGPFKPDLRQALGSYVDQYTTAAAQAVHNSGTRRHFQVIGPDLVVQSNGRMRFFYGRAYVPSMLPPNVTAADIR